jgi:hypothetical protein
MSLILFSAIFWVFAIISILVRALETEKIPKAFVIILKVVPAFSAAVAVLLLPDSLNLFEYLLAGALLLCGLGDAAMEVNILPGLGLFLFGHVVYTVNFIQLSLQFGAGNMLLGWLVFFCVLGAMLVYIFYFLRYLRTTERDVPDEMFKAVTVYALMISLTLCSTVILWISSGLLVAALPVIGGILFIISDSVIGIREFHHDLGKANNVILITYFPAIFLLALSLWIFAA